MSGLSVKPACPSSVVEWVLVLGAQDSGSCMRGTSPVPRGYCQDTKGDSYSPDLAPNAFDYFQTLKLLLNY